MIRDNAKNRVNALVLINEEGGYKNSNYQPSKRSDSMNASLPHPKIDKIDDLGGTGEVSKDVSFINSLISNHDEVKDKRLTLIRLQIMYFIEHPVT